MKTIILTSKTHGNKECFVDDEDYDFLMQWKWHVELNHGNYYAIRHEKPSGQKLTAIKMHRVVMKVTEKHEIVDHENHNTLDNQKSNLRRCNVIQNAKNRSSYGKSQYLGVSFMKKKAETGNPNVWQANCQNRYIGLFKTEEEAARAYDQKALEVHGEFANLNFKLK